MDAYAQFVDCGHILNADGSIWPEGCYGNALGDLERLGMTSGNLEAPHLTLVNQDGTEERAEIGTPLETERKAHKMGEPAGVKEQACRNLFDSIGTRCRTKEQHASVIIALTQCCSMPARLIAALRIHGTAGLDEHAPMNVKVSFDHDGNAHVRYTLVDSIKERNGSLETESVIAPNGTITSGTFTWTGPAYHFED